MNRPAAIFLRIILDYEENAFVVSLQKSALRTSLVTEMSHM